MPPISDDADPAEQARRLSAQAELLAVSASLYARLDPDCVDEMRTLVAEAHALARRGREVAEHHRRLAQAEADAGRVLDEGLRLIDLDLVDDAFDPARQARAVVSRVLAGSERGRPIRKLPH